MCRLIGSRFDNDIYYRLGDNWFTRIALLLLVLSLALVTVTVTMPPFIILLEALAVLAVLVVTVLVMQVVAVTMRTALKFLRWFVCFRRNPMLSVWLFHVWIWLKHWCLAYQQCPWRWLHNAYVLKFYSFIFTFTVHCLF